MIRLLSLLLVAALFWLILTREETVELGPGVKAPDAPLQTKPASTETLVLNGYRLEPLADFSIKAKVLGREDYSWDREADLAPVDLALGWGRMSDESVLAAVEIDQSDRWYHWRVRGRRIPRREVVTHSANMHLIPYDEDVRAWFDDVRRGQIVSIQGQLVRAEADDGWRWTSSLTRGDTGADSCELILVRQIRVVE